MPVTIRPDSWSIFPLNSARLDFHAPANPIFSTYRLGSAPPAL
ncbi:hypothetical protein B8V81_1694 [Paenibacillus pasadenensis]|uniref:Uncharacterized protein n=1 Tax=Paenibacillus pasadenensis TaxID=217090 RepID=A0A2N5NB29_9BACL|nr:hypothetical protein B8V81_1694 [Paenibacillus pasadenensis]